MRVPHRAGDHHDQVAAQPALQRRRHQGHDIEEIVKTVVKRDFEATGMGVPPPQYLKRYNETAATPLPDWAMDTLEARGEGTDPAMDTPQGRLKAARAAELDEVVKTGRTHLMDAVPIRMGQEIGGWAYQVAQNIERIEGCLPRLFKLAIGGTAVGTGVNAHPEFGRRVAARLAEYAGRTVLTAGWFVTAKTVLTRKDEPMEFVSFEDTTALYETTFFPRAFDRFSVLLAPTKPFILRGRVEEDFGAVSLTVGEVLAPTRKMKD